MNAAERDQWLAANHRYLVAEIARLRTLLARRAATKNDDGALARAEAEVAAARAALPGPAALDVLVAAFGLTPFEKELLLLLAAVELDGATAELSALLNGTGQGRAVTFSLALVCLSEAHWSALTPGAALRHWRLVEVGPGETLTHSPLRLDEWALHFITGAGQIDSRLHAVVTPLASDVALTPSQAELAGALLRLWQGHDRGALPVVQLCGNGESAAHIAAVACARAGWSAFRLSAEDLPPTSTERDAFIRLWEREMLLHGCALFVAAEDLDGPDQTRRLRGMLSRLRGPVVAVVASPVSLPERDNVTFDVPVISSGEQRALWRQALGPAAEKLNGDVDRLVNQFRLDPQAIMNVGAALNGAAGQDGVELGQRLWQACRRQARPRLEELAQPIRSKVGWDDLVLPELQRQTLAEISAQVRQRVKVYEDWGFAAKNARGMGVAALFHGPSGTGKTLAAEVLANELALDLYRIDLSTVVSKYIGETEKNLRRVFDAAEYGGAILLFDEADALFGKRSEVKDSHDRYANIEVSYLLQRMEAYRGLAILTTNQKQALDSAFLRRLRFVVRFPFPDAAQRAEIWRRAFPAQTPTEALDVYKLARLNVAGGHIRNIALNAAFLAADRGRPVTMAELRAAAQTEYAKLEKPVTAEVRDWA
ncbi:MAG TPA: ATP-binding protein [Gammaproteobacteria bacterium]|nr:ATP-binding protein [Gammaproteobacteria bacterium]